MSLEGDAVIFDYPAKSGQRRVQAITDPATLAIVRSLKRRRSGGRLLAYRVGRAGAGRRARERVEAAVVAMLET